MAIVIAELEGEMIAAANDLQFERAALLRDQMEALRKGDFGDGQAKRRYGSTYYQRTPTKRRAKKVHKGKTYKPGRRRR